MQSDAVWITGSAKSGKTDALIAQLEQWGKPAEAQQALYDGDSPVQENPCQGKRLLVFAANSDNRGVLMQRIAQQIQGNSLITSTTPFAFFETEVFLFWPLVIQQLQLRGYFPYRLRPEAEQFLALRVWGNAAIEPFQQVELGSVDQWVRRILDLTQLAASSGTALECLAESLRVDSAEINLSKEMAERIQALALQWRSWCLARGMLTYGLITELFWQYLLPHETYLGQFLQRFFAIAADDVDNYPAIARTLFEKALDLGLPGIFTYSLTGGIRKGLGADPDYLLGLRDRCTEMNVSDSGSPDLQTIDPSFGVSLSHEPQFYSIQTVSRIQLLHQVAQQIIVAIQDGLIQPQEVAIVGPGLDPLARYTLIEALQRVDIPVEPLRDQRPLQSSAMIRSLLTLLALVYPGLGYLVETEQIAEMLVVLSQAPTTVKRGEGIDPVRAGLLADYCFRPHPERPELLPIEVYSRWDRLGHSTAQAYESIRQWIAQQQGTLQVGASSSGASPASLGQKSPPVAIASYLTLSPAFIIDRAIQTFLVNRPLSPDQISVLRELIETTQHYWEVDARLRKTEPDWLPMSKAIAEFIQLLRRGVITANPYPAGGRQNQRAVILATTFQYLNARLQHPWQFWLDAGSQLWQYGGEVDLWAASLFLKTQSTTAQSQSFSASRMSATLTELIGRTQTRIYLCHSDLAVNGQAQIGPLLSWVEAATPTDSFI